MIKFSQKNVEKSDILNLIDDESLNLEVHLTFQKKLNDQILSYLKSFMSENSFANDCENIDSMSDYLNNSSKALKKSSNNLSKFQALQSKLTSMKKAISELEQPSSNFVKTQIDDYNKKYTETLEKTDSTTIEIQAFIAQCEQDDILKELLLERELSKKSNAFVNKISELQLLPIPSNSSENEIEIVENIYPEVITTDECSIETKTTQNISDTESADNLLYTDLVDDSSNDITIEENSDDSEDTPSNTTSEIDYVEDTSAQDNTSETNTSADEEKNMNQLVESSKLIENTLIISEKNGNVILPYTLEELNTALKKNPYKYENIEDVIKKKYTKPMKYYKNSSIARFKETFKLVRERGNGSLKHAWDLALEAFFNYDLHPAIISACKSIDELDIYLSCLEYDELEDFRFFKIIFDVLPVLSKKKKILV